MDDLSIRQGETLTLTIRSKDTTAITVRFVAKKDGNIEIDETAAFADVDGKWTASIQTNDTIIPLGDYEYMLILTYAGAVVRKIPDPANCEDDNCEFPILTICEALDLEVS